MKSLERKYLTDSLTEEELLEFRERLEDESPLDTGSRMVEEWSEMSLSGDESDLTGADIMRIRRKIDSSIRKRPFFLKTSWLVSSAAAVLIAFLLGTTLSLLNEKRSVETREVCLSTASGEKSHVALPDGTLVKLKEGSSLAYKFAAFNGRNREVSFDGEGYFEVAKDETKPFIVNAGGLKVEVLGTKFLLVRRDSLQRAEIVLDEGKVRLESVLGDCTVTLVGGQQASLDFSTGMIAVSMADRLGRSEFNSTGLEFSDSSFEEILAALSEIYNADIRVMDRCPEQHFTGALPASDLSEALEILSKVYSLDISLSSGTFWVSSSR